MNLRLGPVCSRPSGEITVPADKSLTHRGLILGAMATSPTELRQPLTGEDCRATLAILQQIGTQVVESPSQWRIEPAAHWSAPSGPLDCGNSGTTMRLLMGVFAGKPMSVEFIGDASLSRRPMGRVATPLRMMGAKIEGDRAPIKLAGGSLRGIDYLSPVASAQVKSAILLAGCQASDTTSVDEPTQSRDHTERMLEALGVPVARCGLRLTVSATQWPGFEFHVPGDISSAAFLMCLVAGLPGAQLTFRRVGVNPTRSGILDVFAQMGIPVHSEGISETLAEPVADLTVTGPNSLAPFTIAGSLVPRLIDEIPVLAVLATQAHGESRISDAAELRVKESDRIEQVVTNLRAMGANIEATADGMVIQGPTPLHGVRAVAHGDHRIAMALAIAALLSTSGETEISGAESIATSYPTFLQDLAEAGVKWTT